VIRPNDNTVVCENADEAASAASSDTAMRAHTKIEPLFDSILCASREQPTLVAAVVWRWREL